MDKARQDGARHGSEKTKEAREEGGGKSTPTVLLSTQRRQGRATMMIRWRAPRTRRQQTADNQARAFFGPYIKTQEENTWGQNWRTPQTEEQKENKRRHRTEATQPRGGGFVDWCGCSISNTIHSITKTSKLCRLSHILTPPPPRSAGWPPEDAAHPRRPAKGSRRRRRT